MSQIASGTFDLKEFILKLFANPPQNKHSFRLELENPDVTDIDSENLEQQKAAAYKNNLLMTIFINGGRLLFGESINPGNISQEQFKLLNSYMESIGYTCKYEYVKNDKGVNTNINIWFEYMV